MHNPGKAFVATLGRASSYTCPTMASEMLSRSPREVQPLVLKPERP